MSLRTRLNGSIGVRLTLWYSLVFILSSAALFALTYFILRSSLQKEDREFIQDKLRVYAGYYHAGGVKAVGEEIEHEKQDEGDDPFFLRLSDPGNNSLLTHLSKDLTDFDEQAFSRAAPGPALWKLVFNRSRNRSIRISALRLSDGNLLQAGKSLDDQQQALGRFQNIFAAVMVPVVLLGFGGGWIFSSRALRPVRDLAATMRRIVVTGRLESRVPSDGADGEMGELVRLFNLMLGKNETLINGMREALDNVAHDLRTPMTRLRGFAEAALTSPAPHESCQDALAECLEDSAEVLTMLKTLMDISEAETGVMRLSLGAIDVPSLLEHVAELYRPVAEEKEIAVSCRAPAGLALAADRSRLRQVLANLLDNALKYTSRGGRVAMEARGEAGRVVISVEDTGIGIPPDEVSRVWDRLFRGDRSRSEKGLGLGLSLVRAIVAAHGGQVGVESRPGAGSRFTISFPAAAPFISRL